MTQLKTKEPVRLRQKALADGNISLYLDIYINGRREYEFLKMYLVPEKNKEDRDRNKETMRLAEAIKALRIVDIQKGRYGFNNKSREVLFYDYYMKMCENRLVEESKGNWGNWRSCMKHLLAYDKHLKSRTFAEIDKDWVLGFRDYLENKAKAWGNDERERKIYDLSRNSCVSYFNKLKCCLNQAYDDGIIVDNPIRGVEGFKPKEGTRMYLTIDEVRKLAQTPCEFKSIKRAFLFSCLTGLRRSDIEKLTWGEVFSQGDYTRIIFSQKKTGGLEYLDLTPEAAELMGKRGKPNEHMFTNLLSPSSTNHYIQQWCTRAGIDKDISFHCGRHTFATMMLDIGTDIYTVSKLLGHRELNTTQIYAKVIDKNKQAAVSKIPSVLTENKSDE